MTFTILAKVLLTIYFFPSAVLLLLHPAPEWGALGSMSDKVLQVLAVACEAFPFSGHSKLSSSIFVHFKFLWHF